MSLNPVKSYCHIIKAVQNESGNGLHRDKNLFSVALHANTVSNPINSLTRRCAVKLGAISSLICRLPTRLRFIVNKFPSHLPLATQTFTCDLNRIRRKKLDD